MKMFKALSLILSCSEKTILQFILIKFCGVLFMPEEEEGKPYKKLTEIVQIFHFFAMNLILYLE